MSVARLLTGPKWEQLKLVQQLKPPFDAALQRVKDYVAPLLGTRPLGAEEFTDHDLQHSTRVAHRIGQILPPEAQLNQPELYILLLAALLHDAGMWTSKQEALGLLGNDEFITFCEQRYPDELKAVRRAVESNERKWMGELGLQRLAATFNRARHPQRLADVVLKDGSPMSGTLRTLIGGEFVEAVADVAVAHSWDRSRVLDDDTLRERQFGDDLVNLRYLAVLLRLGDLLDLGEGRVSTLLWAYLGPLNPESEAHWRKEAALKLERCEPDHIQISGKFDIDGQGLQAAEAYRLACDWTQWIKDEIEGGALVLSGRMDEELAHRCNFGKLKLDTSRVTVTGLILGQQVSFSLDRKRVLALLGDAIYSRGCVFVRELLQNAVDATRAQIVRDHRDRINAHDPKYPPDRPWDWPQEIVRQSKYAIEISTEEETLNGIQFLVYTITDHGIGMTLQQIREHFLQIGRSFYKTTQYEQEFSHSPISQFGIGFLSCLMVADRIEIVTRAHEESAGLRMTMQTPSEFFLVEKASAAQAGTRVSLWIDPAKKRPEWWDVLPMLEFAPLFGLSEMPPSEELDKRRFPEASRQWGAFLELGLTEKKSNSSRTEFGPRIHIENPDQFLQLETLIDSPSGRRLATGQVLVSQPLKNGIPDAIDAFHSFYGLRGFWMRCEMKYGDFGSWVPCTILNFSHVPAGSLTAGREIRDAWFIDVVHQKVGWHLFDGVHRELNSRSTEAAAIWVLLNRNSKHFRPPIRLPCRTGSELRWLNMEEIRSQYDRVAIVPFHVAWRGPGDASIACVGFLEDRRFLWEPLVDCGVMAFGNLCSAYLWPPHTNQNGLDAVDAKATFLADGLRLWRSAVLEQEVGDSERVSATFVLSQDLPEYDRGGDPWKYLGWLKYTPDESMSLVETEICKLFESIGPIELPKDLLHVTLEGTDDWR